MHAMLAALTAILLVAGTAAAEDKAPSAQSQRMKDCNAQAAEKKLAGDDRRHFMSECLKTHGAGHNGDHDKAARPHGSSDGHSAQSEKMKTCNQEAGAKNLHGDERRQFMSQCLKGEKKS
jgi:hypothetical protein